MGINNLNQVAIVDTESCANLVNVDKPFILVLKKGENLFEGILNCADAVNLQSAVITGLGAVDDVTLAYYNLAIREYQTQLFPGMHELLSLNGNITFVDGKRFLHLHGALSQPDYSVIGGHLMDATVGPTAEISIVPLSEPIIRSYDNEIGLNLMCAINPYGEES